MSTPVSYDVNGYTLGGRVARPDGDPVGTVVALHGGTYDSGYYDTGDDSLLALGPQRGYTVIALDRPGYGSSSTIPDGGTGFSAQGALIAGALNQIAQNEAAPLGLVGHSIGGMIAIVAAGQTDADLVGVEVSGLGELWQPGIREMWGSLVGDAPAVELPPEAHAGVMLGPVETQKPNSVQLDGELLRPMPMDELRDVVEWSDRLPTAAAGIDVPISLTLAEFDNIWQADEAAQSALAGHFTNSPKVTAGQFTGAGHSVELHANADDFAATQLDFIDACRP